MSLVIAALRGLIVPVTSLAVTPFLWGATGIWLVPVISEVAGLGATVILLVRWARMRRHPSPASVVAAKPLPKQHRKG